MKVLDLTRKFTYNGMTLPDPNPALAPDQVREIFAMQYPELNNAVVEGPVTKGVTSTYSFLRSVGSKGSNSDPLLVRAMLEKTLGTVEESSVDFSSTNEAARLVRKISESHSGKKMLPPSLAYRQLG